MKILFSMRHAGAIRNFESTIRELADRGHQVHLSFVLRDKGGDGDRGVGPETVIARLTSDCPSVTTGYIPKRSGSRWFGLARAVRFLADSLRYRLPAYAAADSLRERAETRLPGPVRVLVRGPWFGWVWFNRLVTRMLTVVDAAIPIDPAVERDLLEQRPDVVVMTPLVDLGSDQVDYVKAARRHGIPSALGVHSWDNLTNKGLIRIMPDRIFVWNEAQRREAIEHHGAPESTVVVTGAHTYDHWFEWKAKRAREAFCAETGLRAERPFLLYLGSSRFIAPREIGFVERWLSVLRRSDVEALREIGVLIRPHPENAQPWDRLESLGFANWAVWPGDGANPVVDELRADYFDSIFHSRAIVGINTSAMIEAGVVGRPTFTVLDDEHRGSQQGTLHFEHLVSVGDGLVQVASGFGEHVEQLARCLSGMSEAGVKGRAFVREFVRPFGEEVRGTDRLVAGIEALADHAILPQQGTKPLYLAVRALCYPVAAVMATRHRGARKAREQRRAQHTSSLLGRLWTAPRKVALNLLLRSLRRPRIRSFVKRYVVPRVMTGETTIPEVAITEKEIRRLQATGKPILLGPWLGEVGFEILYWIPFLNWVKGFADLDPDRLVAVSRGGVADWYRTITHNYVEVLDHMTQERYLHNNLRRVQGGKQKQRRLSEVDREVVDLAKAATGVGDFEILHPGLMYNLFMRYWKRHASVRLMDQFTDFKPYLTETAATLAEGLPADYVAVRFYFNDSFPDTPANREFAADVIRRVTKHTDVVLLNPGFAMDEHQDLDPNTSARVHSLEQLMRPANNLGLQTAVIAGARAFVGTYGGLSYLPPFFGVDSLAFYSSPEGFHGHHLEFAEYVFRRGGGASFNAVEVGRSRLLGLALGAGDPVLREGESCSPVSRG